MTSRSITEKEIEYLENCKKQNNNDNNNYIFKNVYVTNSDLSGEIPKYENFIDIFGKEDASKTYKSINVGTMNKQSSKAFILKDIISPKVLYYSGNKGSHILYENEEDKKLLKKSSKKKENFLLMDDVVKSSLMLTILPFDYDSRKYFCSMFFHIKENAYFHNDPIVPISKDWYKGILSFNMRIDNKLKVKKHNIPTTLELNWSFDFRPANALMEELDLEVMHFEHDPSIFNSEGIELDSIEWYVHVGLTEDVVTYTYQSTDYKNKYKKNNDNDEYKLYRIKDADFFRKNNEIQNKDTKTNYFQKYDSNKKILNELKNKLCFLRSNGINFNDIPVVPFDENKNNSFKWQKIPESKKYTRYKKIIIKQYEEDNINEFRTNKDSPLKFNRVKLSKSANQQFGFILKAVIKANISSSYLKDEEKLELFHSPQYKSNDVNRNNPKFRLFEFRCILHKDLNIDAKFLNNVDYNYDNRVVDSNLNEKYLKNTFTMIFETEKSDNIYKQITYIREKCNIKEVVKNTDIIIDEQTKEVKLNLNKILLIKNSVYFENIYSLFNGDSYFSEVKAKEFKLKNIDCISFSQILFYCYNGYFPNCELYNEYDWLAISIVARRLIFQKIAGFCEYKIKELITKENVYIILEIASVYINIY
ncbi:hypothetical protein H8356DRAFT_946361 [Neocallimastix lanati (nom. inval.)]|nr:hypothetical protein H8356DRAFT_946361 [Neocallimastix sp. JGI-2020a]